MRVALVTDGIWPYVLGGMQKHSYYLCKYLALNNIYVDLFHFNRSNYNINQLEFFTAHEKKYIRSVIVDFPVSRNYPGAYVINSYKYSQLIFNALKENLNHYHFIYTKGFTGWYLLKQKQNGNIKCAPVGVKFHGYEMFQKPPGFKAFLQQIVLLRRPVSNISKMADLVFSYGGNITSIVKSVGVLPERIFELPSGVEASSLAVAPQPVLGNIKFLFLGRYERRKGIEELNKAIKMLAAGTQKNYEFHFIGPLPNEKKLNLPALYYHGEIRDKAKLHELISKCDVLLCPSWSEGMPNSILEAMAAGLAVMATDVGAVNVLVNPNTGWLINNTAPVTIKKTLSEILDTSAHEINQRKQNALNHIKEKFTWENLADVFIKGVLGRN